MKITIGDLLSREESSFYTLNKFCRDTLGVEAIQNIRTSLLRIRRKYSICHTNLQNCDSGQCRASEYDYDYEFSTFSRSVNVVNGELW